MIGGVIWKNDWVLMNRAWGWSYLARNLKRMRWRYKNEDKRYRSYFEIMVNIGLHVKVHPLVQVYDTVGEGKWGIK